MARKSRERHGGGDGVEDVRPAKLHAMVTAQMAQVCLLFGRAAFRDVHVLAAVDAEHKYNLDCRTQKSCNMTRGTHFDGISSGGGGEETNLLMRAPSSRSSSAVRSAVEEASHLKFWMESSVSELSPSLEYPKDSFLERSAQSSKWQHSSF